jgi:Domain of unknown function (DUF4373)
MTRIDFFIHDHDASQDPKIKALMRRFGPAGYSVFFMTLEYLCAQDLKPIQLGEKWAQEEFTLYLCLFNEKREADIALFNEIIDQACILGLFDKNQWQQKKELWCPKLENRLQERFKHKEKETERKRNYREKIKNEQCPTGHNGTTWDEPGQGGDVPTLESAKETYGESLFPPKDCSKEEQKALEYIQTHASHDPNFQNLSWVPGFLKITFSEAPQKYSALKPEHILHCWRQACDVTFERGKGPSYLKSTFQGKLREFKPEQLSAHTRQNMSETDFPEYPKDRRGQYTSDLGNSLFPGNDFRVPFEQLDLNSKKHRVVARGFIQDGQFDLEQLHHPELSGFLREYCEKFPAIAVTEPFKTAYERLKANDAL